MKKPPFFLLLFCLLLIPAETQAWQGENDSEANIKAHEAANCITIPSAKLDKIATISGASRYRKQLPSQSCDQLTRQWYLSGLTEDDAWVLVNDDRGRRIYLSQDNKWIIEFCSFSGILRDKSECEIFPTPKQKVDTDLVNLMNKLSTKKADKIEEPLLNKIHKGTVTIEQYPNTIKFIQGSFEKEFQKPNSALTALYSVSTLDLEYQGTDGVIDANQSKGIRPILWNEKITAKSFPLLSFFSNTKTAIGILSSQAGATGRSTQELLFLDTISYQNNAISGQDLREPELHKN